MSLAVYSAANFANVNSNGNANANNASNVNGVRPDSLPVQTELIPAYRLREGRDILSAVTADKYQQAQLQLRLQSL